MSNTLLNALTVVVLAAHVAALVAAIVRHNAVPILALNLVAGAAILLALAANHSWATAPIDWQLAAMAVFEIVAACLALAGFRRLRLARPLSCAVFGVHLLASAALVLFALTFKITRLI